MSRISETPDGVLETYDWQDVAEDLKEKLNKQKEIINKIKEKSIMYYDPEYSKIYGELCSIPGANNTRTPVIVIDDEIMKLLEEIE